MFFSHKKDFYCQGLLLSKRFDLILKLLVFLYNMNFHILGSFELKYI